MGSGRQLMVVLTKAWDAIFWSLRVPLMGSIKGSFKGLYGFL